MIIKSFDEILKDMCDSLDAYILKYIGDKKIRRENSNFIYLYLKAVSKGFEVINNTCVLLQRKFDPETCEESDLVSMAALVGTSKLGGSPSYAEVSVSSVDPITLPAGLYKFYITDSLYYYASIAEDLSVTDAPQVVIFTSSLDGSYPITDIATAIIVDENNVAIRDDIVFFVKENNDLLGYETESNFEFRKRLMNDTDRQDVLSELEVAIKKLPFVRNVKLKFNNTMNEVFLPDGSPVDPYRLVIMVDDYFKILTLDQKLAFGNAVFQKFLYQTQSPSEPSKGETVKVPSDLLSSGHFDVNVLYRERRYFKLHLRITFDELLTSQEKAELDIDNLLIPYKTGIETKFITEDIFYGVLKDVREPSVKLVGVDIYEKLNGSYTETEFIKTENFYKYFLKEVEYEAIL